MKRAWQFALAALLCAALPAAAQNYPTKPVRIITSEPAGINDVATRIIAQGLAAALGQAVIVENRGSAAITGTMAARAAPDGYTLLCYGSTLWLAPLMREKIGYDPIRDFAPITLAVASPGVLVVHPSVAATSAAELIALAKARPGVLNYGGGGPGSVPHLAMELFKAKAGINIVRIPYKGAAPAVNAVMANQVQAVVTTAGSVMSHMKSGRLRGLGVGSLKPSPLAPGLPTISETGLPGYEFRSTWGIFAPSRTPAAVIARINQEAVRILAHAEVRQRMMDAGIETVGSTAQVLADTVRTEVNVLGALIKELGIRDD